MTLKNVLLGSVLGGALLLQGCSSSAGKSGSADANGAKFESYTYQLEHNGCSTGEKTFDSLLAYCKALRDDAVNGGCAAQLREQLFNEQCSSLGMKFREAPSHGQSPPSPIAQPNPPPPAKQEPPKSAPDRSQEHECPWNLKKHESYSIYQTMGIELQVDCESVSGWNGEQHVNETLKFLIDQQSLFQDWKRRPKVIRIGGRSFHNSKAEVVQIPAGYSRPDDLINWLMDTRTLYTFEVEEFQSQVRFSYVFYDLAKKPDGTMVDVGTGALLGYGPRGLPAQDLNVLRKLKTQILSLKDDFPNVRISHGNQFSHYLVSNWNRSYTIAPELSEAELNQYFRFLAHFLKIRKSYAPTTLHYLLDGYPRADFDQARKVLELMMQVKPEVLSLGFSDVQVTSPSLYGTDLRQRLRISQSGAKVIKIENVGKRFGKTMTAREELSKCLRDFAEKAVKIYYCDGEGTSQALGQ